MKGGEVISLLRKHSYAGGPIRVPSKSPIFDAKKSSLPP